MDVVQVFSDEVQSLMDVKPPVSKAKMGQITRAAMKGVKFYKHIVQIVEKFIGRSRPEYKVPGLYVIDSIVRQSRHQFGAERDVYAARFSRNLQITFSNLFSSCLPDDKPKIVRVLNLWQKNGVFSSQVIQPLLDMANPNSSLTLPTESTLSADSPGNINLESNKSGHNSKYLSHHSNKTNNSNQQYVKNMGSSSKHARNSDANVRYSKSMIDYEYDEDDEDDGDETPTEAEPPLSSTLNKIEMEQRNRNEATISNVPSSHLQQHQLQQTSTTNHHNSTRNDQDPVLERWNKLIKQQLIPNDSLTENSLAPDRRSHRDRSRSPVYHDKSALARQEQVPALLPTAKVSAGNSGETESMRKAERERKCLPKIRDKHLTVCSSTLWLGHVPKTVSEADISDAFGEYGAITSIDLIPPRGCAYVCMDRRQDAKRALMESKDLKLNGSHIKMAWAPGKGFKEYKQLKEFWEVDTGSSYIPYSKIDSSIDFDILEEGGVIDEESMSAEMRVLRDRKATGKNEKTEEIQASNMSLPLPALPILTQPPPFSIRPPNLSSMSMPPSMSQASSISGMPYGGQPGITSINTGQLLGSQDGQKSKLGNEYIPSPNSLDQQMSMTEMQISMVEQQLQQIQQAQGMNQPQSLPNMQIFQNQPNPMLFDMQMLHGGPPIMDPQQQQQMSMFPGQSHLLGPPPMLPISQAGMNPSMNGNQMPHYGGRY